MHLKNLWLSLLVIPALLLAACSGTALSLDPLAAPAALPVQQATPAEDGAPASLAALQDTFERIYQQVNPSVVNIQVTAGSSAGLGEAAGLGSGFVWDEAGHIVTNAHVVSGAGEINVTFADGSSAPASLVGADPYSDLAVIRVEAPAGQLQPVELADSTQVRVGQLAIAIGNPFGLQGTMTQGIVSGLSRSLSVDAETSLNQPGARYSIPDIIQTDAPINPGNSGGVLVDDQGRVMGVTAAIASDTRANSGVGFVIPSALVQKFVPELIETGHVRHAWMGITGATLTPDLAEAAGLPDGQRGALVLAITAGGPAAEAGLRAAEQQSSASGGSVGPGGDVVVAIDGQPVQRFEDMISYLFNQTVPGQTITLTVLRQGEEQSLPLTLGELPGSP